MTTRIGTDIVEIQRIRNLFQKYGDHFTRRFFSNAERTFARDQSDETTWYARFWAGREAVFKIFGTGNYWQDTRFQPRQTGRLEVTFTGPSFHRNTPVPRNANWDVTTTRDSKRAVAIAACEWTE